jgi:hypothetical protein
MSKISNAEKKNEKGKFTGGVTYEDLSELKNNYKINHDYSKSIDLDSKMLNKTNVLEFLRKGLDVNMILNRNPIVFQVQDQESLEVFELLGADSNIKNFDLKTLDPFTFSVFMLRRNWDIFRVKLERISQYKTLTLLTEVEDIEIFEFLQSVKYNKINCLDIDDKDKFTIFMNYINYGTNREDAFKLAKMIKHHFEQKDYYNYKFGTQQHPKKIRYFVEILKEYPLDESKLSRLYEIIKEFDPKMMNEYCRRALDYIDCSWTSSVIDAYVRNLYKLGIDTKKIDKNGRSFYEELIKQPRKNKMIIEIIDSIHASNTIALDKETTINAKNKSAKATQDEKAEVKKTNGAKKKKTGNNGLNSTMPGGIGLLKIIEKNIFKLLDEHISFDGERHSWALLSISTENILMNFKPIEALQIADEIIEFSDVMEDFLIHLEDNRELVVHREKIGKSLLPFLYGEDLTGITTATLFAQGLLSISMVGKTDFSNYCMLVDNRFASSIENYEEYLNRFLGTATSFKWISGSRDVNVTFIVIENQDIKTPAMKKRKVYKE